METRRSSGRLQPIITNNESEELFSSFNQLSMGTSAAGSSRAVSSPVLSPSSSSLRSVDRRSSSRHDPPPPSSPLQHRTPVPRRTPSSSSLRGDRRESTASLQKKASVSSLRSVGPNNSGSPRPSLSRKSSANLLSSARPRTPSVMAETPPSAPPPAPTASSVASEHFGKEIALHQVADLQSKTVVIIQDSCYGHRYSRPRTSKVGLESIVERPERMHAGVLGMSTAYVRMGKRHEGGRFTPHPDLDLQSLPVPPFQIRKTSRSVPLSSPSVTHVHGTKWMEDLKDMCDAAESRLALNGKELVRPQSRSGKDESSSHQSQHKLHEGDLYLCSESLGAFEGALGGVCEAVDYVFGPGTPSRAFVCIRPPGHHCSSNYPSGFCWLNNVHVGIAHGAMTHGLTHAAILDFDLHHGDGSQDIAWEQNWKAHTASKNAANYKKTAIGYFSLHDINSYPCEDGDGNKVRNASVCVDNAHGQSIWNVHLEPWKSTQEFWELYNTKYAILLEKARSFLRHHTQRLTDTPGGPAPKAAIFLSAGFDASEWEGAGMQRHKVNVPTDFYARFTADVVKLAQEEGLGVNDRIVSVLEGGYSERALISGVLSHLSGLSDTRGSAFADDLGDQGSRLASEMSQRLGLSNEHRGSSIPVNPTTEDISAFDTEWWKPAALEELETKVHPPPPTPARKPREKGFPTYCAPTQASEAKAIIPQRERTSNSFQQGADNVLYVSHPIPAVDWATAAHEMSKVLIPTDRRTLSCQHSELKAEGARNRQQRVSANAAELQRPTTSDRGHMQLRERKQKATPGTEVVSGSKAPRPASRSTRRTTIASVSDLPDSSAVDNSESVPKSDPVTTPSSPQISTSSNAAPAADTAKEDSGSHPKSRESSRPQSSGKDRTSQSRPTSAAGSKTTEKKSRPGLGSRSATGPTPRSSPRKQPAAPASSRKVSTKPNPNLESQSRPLSRDPEDNENEDLDGIAQGMKKLSIKLRMPTPEEHAAKIKAAEKQMKSTKKTPKKPQTPRAAKSAPMKGTSEKKPRSKTAPTSPDESIPVDYPRHDQHLPTTQETFSASAPLPDDPESKIAIYPPSEPSRPTTDPPPDTDTKDDATMPSPPLTPQSAQAGSNPNITAPSQTQENTVPNPHPGSAKLPIFTPTSVIPFAAPSTAQNPTGDDHSGSVNQGVDQGGNV